jgi:hypothetical protein
MNTMQNLRDEIKREIASQMRAAGIAFNVESLDEAVEMIGDAADYILEVYEEPTTAEKVAYWLEDTKMLFPEDLKKIQVAETLAR